MFDPWAIDIHDYLQAVAEGPAVGFDDCGQDRQPTPPSL